jgi:DNA-binding response OmpR family regulator
MDPVTKKPKILFVEDDPTLSGLFKMRMEAEGFEVLAVNDGESALKQGPAFQPDLVLSDLMMPNVSGYDVISALRGNPATSQCKIIILSALSRPEDVEKAKTLGADDYLVKSQVVTDDIMDRIRSLLGLPPGTFKTGM